MYTTINLIKLMKEVNKLRDGLFQPFIIVLHILEYSNDYLIFKPLINMFNNNNNIICLHSSWWFTHSFSNFLAQDRRK